MVTKWSGHIEKFSDLIYVIPRKAVSGMKVPAVIFAEEDMIPKIIEDMSPQQLVNVAMLPGIRYASIGMPDIHWGYGMPVGGVAGFSVEEGVISPGGVGVDINCGVRLLKTAITCDDLARRDISRLADILFSKVPCGVGVGGPVHFSKKEVKGALREGASWAVSKGFGKKDDLQRIEEGGFMKNADPSAVPDEAVSKGREQLGSLGSGNHFLEVQYVDEIYDEEQASEFGLFKGQITVMIHTGSRRLGYLVADHYVKFFQRVVSKYEILLPDRQLACAPFRSSEGKRYFSAMAAAANYAWANRQLITHFVREAFQKFFSTPWERLGIDILYDVAHNIAKKEEHSFPEEFGSSKLVKETLVVHRKGATRAFPGQPVIIPGDMGTYSFILVGTEEAMRISFGTTCHGAGRLMSRSQARKRVNSRDLIDELRRRGIVIKARSLSTVAEEAPGAYKDADQITRIVDRLGIARRVVRLKPLAVVKG